MKTNSLFKNRKQKVVYIILFILMIGVFIYLGTINFNVSESDSEKFSSEFPTVDAENIYVYSTATEVLDKISDDAIILFGSSSNEFTEQYASIINEVAIESGINKILYYDFIEDREHNNGNYELLVKELEPYLLTDDMGNTEIYAPTFLIVKDGFVLYIDNNLNFVSGDITPNEYWTTLQTGIFKETVRSVFTDFIGELQ